MLKLYEEKNDRRWRIMVEEEDNVPEDRKPKTMGGLFDIVAK